MFKPLELGPAQGFARDARFWPATPPSEPEAPQPLAAPPEPLDLVDLARSEGYRRGREEALAEVAERHEADRIAEARFALSFGRLDEAGEAQLAKRLRETVTALCHSLIADAAHDPALLARRAQIAAQLLSRADDDRTFRLNPDDIALLRDRLPADWKIIGDAALERGSIRVETPHGGVEDGTDTWRRAIDEALRAC